MLCKVSLCSKILKHVLYNNTVYCMNIWCKDFSFCDFLLYRTYICLLHRIVYHFKKKVELEFCNILYKSNSKSKMIFVKKENKKQMNCKQTNFKKCSIINL